MTEDEKGAVLDAINELIDAMYVDYVWNDEQFAAAKEKIIRVTGAKQDELGDWAEYA